MVLGMHRSGTSAVTRALTELGLDAGADPLMEATDANPTGHFEVGRLTGLDDEILDALGGRWAAPPILDPTAVTSLADGEFGLRARELTAEIFASPGWVWKDPRAALLLPFWRAVFEPEPPAVVVIRHPLAVARSLTARNGMAPAYGLALWERYTRVLLRDLEGMRCFVVDYDTTVEHPDRFVADVIAFLSTTGMEAHRLSPGTAAEAFVGDHRHQVVTDDVWGADRTVSEELRSLRELTTGILGVHDAFPAAALGPETPGLQLAFDEHKRLSRYEERVPQLEGEIGLRESTIEDLMAEIDRRSAQAGALATDLMALRAEHASAQERLDRFEGLLPVRLARRMKRMVGRG